MENSEKYMDIPAEKFCFAQAEKRLTDQKFKDKPIGYFKDAWIRFRKNKASIVAAIIILLIALFSVLTPLLTTKFDASFMCTYYAKKEPRNLFLRQLGIADGTTKRDFSEKGYISALAIGIGAENWDGKHTSLNGALHTDYQPIRRFNHTVEQLDPATNQQKTFYNANIDTYLEVGFLYLDVEQETYRELRAWEEETGLHLLYPLIDNNEYTADPNNANLWYKTDRKYNPIKQRSDGSYRTISYSEDLTLEDNYLRDANGDLVYYRYSGGGTTDTAMYRVRVLYYNYYRYQNGFEPEYLLGTDSQGYDLALRMANGVRLSLLVAVFVSVINFVIGAIYGAIEGYYGGAIDLTLERISDILSGVPFIVVATLFQIHLAKKVGAVPSLLFAFVLTGWLGTAANVRMQFYRFKNQEYVMAARTLGAKDARIIWKHIFPNSLGTLITSSVLVIPSVIFSESMLSFLGIVKLGDSTTTSLGTLLSDASNIWTNYPHLMIFPSLIISLLMISFNLFGNGLRDAFNPSLRGVEE